MLLVYVRLCEVQNTKWRIKPQKSTPNEDNFHKTTNYVSGSRKCSSDCR